MPEWEFQRWQRYAAERGLPSRRLELQTAIVALTVARAMGGNTSMQVSDFLIHTEAASNKRDQTPDKDRSAVSVFAGVAGVRRLGQKKRNKRKAN